MKNMANEKGSGDSVELTPETRSAVARAEEITEVISERLKGGSADAKKGVDLGKIAQKLFRRKERATSSDKK